MPEIKHTHAILYVAQQTYTMFESGILDKPNCMLYPKNSQTHITKKISISVSIPGQNPEKQPTNHTIGWMDGKSRSRQYSRPRVKVFSCSPFTHSRRLRALHVYYWKQGVHWKNITHHEAQIGQLRNGTKVYTYLCKSWLEPNLLK